MAEKKYKNEASHYVPMEDGVVNCLLCPIGCMLLPGETGVCHCRVNRNGRLLSLNYGWIRALSMEPIEKAGFMQFYPGRAIVRTGSFGCPLQCSYCSAPKLKSSAGSGKNIIPQDILELAISLKDKGNCGIAYSYGEPAMWHEFVLECATLVGEAGLANVMTTNGYLNREPLEELLPLIDAWNIDLGVLAQYGMRWICVRNTVTRVVDSGRHVELTVYMPADDPDAPENIGYLAQYIGKNWGEVIPLHIVGMSTMLEAPPQCDSNLTLAEEYAKSYLHHVEMEKRY